MRRTQSQPQRSFVGSHVHVPETHRGANAGRRPLSGFNEATPHRSRRSRQLRQRPGGCRCGETAGRWSLRQLRRGFARSSGDDGCPTPPSWLMSSSSGTSRLACSTRVSAISRWKRGCDDPRISPRPLPKFGRSVLDPPLKSGPPSRSAPFLTGAENEFGVFAGNLQHQEVAKMPQHLSNKCWRFSPLATSWSISIRTLRASC